MFHCSAVLQNDAGNEIAEQDRGTEQQGPKNEMQPDTHFQK
jgi:hypothetical protein